MSGEAANAPVLERAARAGTSTGKAKAKRRETLVVIGNGPVGYKFCEALAAEQAPQRVVVFGEETRPAYNRVILTQLFSRGSADELSMAPRSWYEEKGIELHTGDPVVEIDRDKRVVRARSGLETGYDKLVLATGSRAFVPPVSGANLPGVFVYRTADDIAAIRGYAPFCRRAAVLGGGLLGLETADAVKKLGPRTWVVERGSSLLARQLDPEGAQLLERHVKALGIQVCTNREVERIEPIGPDRLLHFRSGEVLRVQMVIFAAGIRARTELASECGLTVHVKGGVVVDDFLQTSDPRIFAIGECASHRGMFYGLAAPGYLMAQQLAAGLARGKRKKFRGTDQSTWLKLAGIAVATLGDFQGGAGHLVARGEGSYRRIALSKNRIVGASAVGDWPDQARMQESIDRRAVVWRWQRARFQRTGRLWRGSAPRPVSQWPAEAIVCNCKGIRRRELTAACAAGCASAEELASRTGASTVCGSCRPLLEEFTGAVARRTETPGARTLLIAAAASLLAAGMIALLPPIPLADTVQRGFSFGTLFGSQLYRQISGFTLLAMCVLGTLLSARKRIARVQWGSVAVWKAVHAVLGVLALATLANHTGFRLGHNLNFVLMTNFLALAAVGALAGGVTALEGRLPARAARQVRALWTGAHIALVWPLPVLILFHVLASYRY